MNFELLATSPIFHFSLHAKELFHSNFLAWLGSDKELKHVFLTVMLKLGITQERIESWGDDFEVLREKDNLDLIVKAGDYTIRKQLRNGKIKDKWIQGGWHLVIENKIKSIPTNEQLDKYTEVIRKNNSDVSKVEKLLLVPTDANVHLKDGWRLVNYTAVTQGLKESLSAIKDSYKKAIIEDYVRMNEALVAILNDHKINENDKFLYVPSCELNELRIADLVGKWRTSHVAEIFKRQTNLKYSIAFTNTYPLIETFKDIGDITIGIQIQGNQYRRCIIGAIGESEIVDRSKGFLKETRKDFRDNLLSTYPDIFEDKRVKGEEGIIYCSYGKGSHGRIFWYQYATIDSNSTIKQIMHCVEEDMKLIKNKFNDM